MSRKWNPESCKAPKRRRVVGELEWSTFEIMVADMKRRGIDEITEYLNTAVHVTAALPIQGQAA